MTKTYCSSCREPAASVAFTRRRWLGGAVACATLVAGRAWAAGPAPGHGVVLQIRQDAPHRIVYQINQADPAYHEAVFNSISAMLKRYVDDVNIAVVVWGPGIHLLAKKPQRPLGPLIQQRARSMAESYGVQFVACGNTMHTVGWEQGDMLDFAQIAEVGASAIMEFQEKGYAYLAW